MLQIVFVKTSWQDCYVRSTEVNPSIEEIIKFIQSAVLGMCDVNKFPSSIVV